MNEFEVNYKRFSDRINYLVNLFLTSEKVAFYLNQDPTDVSAWSNSVTLIEPPVRIDYTYFLAKNNEFNALWLEKGIGDIYKSGTVEENEARIKGREKKKDLKKQMY